MTLLETVLVKMGLKTDVIGAPVHNGSTPVYFTDVYPNDQGTFTFAWRTTDHSQGAVEDYPTKEAAEFARVTWSAIKQRQQKVSFVNEGL